MAHTYNVTLRGVGISAYRTLAVVIPFNPLRAQFVCRRILQNVINVSGFGGAPDGMRPKCRRVNNIKMVLEEMGWGGMNCKNLT